MGIVRKAAPFDQARGMVLIRGHRSVTSCSSRRQIPLVDTVTMRWSKAISTGNAPRVRKTSRR